ncbi:MAG: sigma-54-dependent Fis family transcriptional regulator [Deltaproteobacteria bacterium]|nr:sigma-54-dependent Fis family transcriptional regulator [Deltaproteobacteria bacterium]
MHETLAASGPTDPPALRAIVGQAPSLRRVLEQAKRVAATRLPVLVIGESGTGKELLARALHELSALADGPLVAVNCGALTRELAESALFGHERGAFTGAGGRKLGWFEEAAGGTLVLDEIGELPLEVQPKLLRVLETGRVRRVGGQGEIAVDVRVVALTLRDLRRDAASGLFRLDLYHRLAGCELRLPSLRERPGDIALLAEHFLAEAAVESGPRVLAPDAMARLLTHDWPGNARELRNTLRRAAALTDSVIDRAALALDTGFAGVCRELGLASRAADAPLRASAASFRPPLVQGDTMTLTGKTFAEMQAAIFHWALCRSRGSRRQAAASLGISRSTFCDRIRRLGLAAG